MLIIQSNLAITYGKLGQSEQALQLKRDVYYGYVKLLGEEHEETLLVAENYALSLIDLRRFEEAKALLRKSMPVARRVLGEGNDITLSLRKVLARALYDDPAATLDDLRDAVTTLEEIEPIARRVLGGAHPFTKRIGISLPEARAALRARETPSPRSN